MKPLMAFLTLIITTAVCCCGSSGDNGEENGGNGNNGDDAPVSIGNIYRIRTSVQVAHSGDFIEVDGTEDFYNNDTITVRNKGKGDVNFIDGTILTLYNNTTTEQIIAKVSPPEMSLLLANQGFQGYVPKGNTLNVNLPNGAKVKVLGTRFFVIFDPDSDIATVGNFDGRVEFSLPNGSQRELPLNTMVDIRPDDSFNFLELRYNPETFDFEADEADTPLDGLNKLRVDHGQPMPWEFIAAEEPAEQPKPITTVIRFLVTSSAGDYIPDLAESWAVDPDGYIVDFYIRQGIYLPDGTPFTSTAVRDELESRWQYAINGNVSFEIIDDYVIRLQLFKPDAFYVLDQMTIFEFEVQLG